MIKNKSAVTKIQAIVIAVIVIGAVAVSSYYAFKPKPKPELVVVTWGKHFEEALKAYAVEPFEKETGVKVKFEYQGSAGEYVPKLRAHKDEPIVDVVWTIATVAHTWAEEGLIIPLDRTLIPNMDKLTPGAIGPYGMWAGWYLYTVSWGINTKLIPADTAYNGSFRWLWDPRLEEKICYPDIVFMTSAGLIWPSLAHGGNEFNVEPGFEAVKKLAPNIHMLYTSAAEVTTVMTAEEAWVVYSTSMNIVKLIKAGLPIEMVNPEDAPILFDIDVFTVVKNGPAYRATGNYELAMKFINIALSGENMKGGCEKLGVMPTNPEVTLGAEAAAFAITKEEYERLYAIDKVQYTTHIDEWTEQWDKEIKPLI